MVQKPEEPSQIVLPFQVQRFKSFNSKYVNTLLYIEESSYILPKVAMAQNCNLSVISFLILNFYTFITVLFSLAFQTSLIVKSYSLYLESIYRTMIYSFSWIYPANLQLNRKLYYKTDHQNKEIIKVDRPSQKKKYYYGAATLQEIWFLLLRTFSVKPKDSVYIYIYESFIHSVTASQICLLIHFCL